MMSSDYRHTLNSLPNGPQWSCSTQDNRETDYPLFPFPLCLLPLLFLPFFFISLNILANAWTKGPAVQTGMDPVTWPASPEGLEQELCPLMPPILGTDSQTNLTLSL